MLTKFNASKIQFYDVIQTKFSYSEMKSRYWCVLKAVKAFVLNMSSSLINVLK